MSRSIDKTNLGYLGSDYQYKLVKCLMEDTRYFQEINSIVDQNTFTEPLLRQFVGTLKDYYSTSGGVMPSYGTMKINLRQKCRLESDVEEWDELIKTLQDTSSEGCEFIKDQAMRFFKQQNMVKVANEILKKASDGDTESYDECIKMMESVLTIGQEEDEGFNPYDIIDDVMTENANCPVPTGFKELDEVLNGGLDKKKLGVVVGPAGFGKTTFSTAVASYASTCRDERNNYKGYKVIQFCFEDDPRDIAKKHFARISQIEAKDLTKPAFIDHSRRIIEDYEEKEIFKDNLIIKKFKPNTKTVLDFETYIKKKINSGFKPDLIIIDYFEPIKKTRVSKSDNQWQMEEACMREIECLAEDFNAAVWLMTQGNKDSFTAAFVNMAQAGGSVTKVQVGHVILSIGRSPEDQRNNKANIAVLKNRQGSLDAWEGVTFNNGTSTISGEGSIEYNSALAYDVNAEQGNSSLTSYGQQIVNQQSRNGLGKKPVGGRDYYSQQSASEWEQGR